MCKENGFTQEQSESVLQETLVFLSMVGSNPGCPSTPSKLVDVGWHTFILYTREYAEFCRDNFGRFIHHCPTDTPELQEGSQTSQATVDFMAANGIVFDPELWSVTAFCNPRGTGCTGRVMPAEAGVCDGCTPIERKALVMANDCSVDNWCNGTPVCNGK